MTVTLNTEPNIADPDDFYEALVALHRDLTPEQSRLVDAKLILLLAHHIGERAILDAALARARSDGPVAPVAAAAPHDRSGAS